jgi:hypothetical protein
MSLARSLSLSISIYIYARWKSMVECHLFVHGLIGVFSLANFLCSYGVFQYPNPIVSWIVAWNSLQHAHGWCASHLLWVHVDDIVVRRYKQKENVHMASFRFHSFVHFTRPSESLTSPTLTHLSFARPKQKGRAIHPIIMGFHLSLSTFGLAYQGKDSVFRFIIMEYI